MVTFIIILVIVYFVWVNREWIRNHMMENTITPRRPIPSGKNFQFAIYDDDDADIEPGEWYKIKGWKYPENYLRMKDKDKRLGVVSPYEEKVMGMEYEDRWKNFLLIGDQPEFKLFLEREPDNKSDKNAIKVIGSAIVNGKTVVKHIGYVQKETAAKLKKIDSINVGSASVSIPVEGRPLVLKILIV
jgi:hypothetical protein